MRIQKIEVSADRQIITGMIVSTSFLKGVQPIYRPEYMLADFAVVVAQWCFDYLKTYNEAPGKNIQNIWSMAKRNGSIREEQADAIEQFLSNLSEHYESSEKFNVQFLLDKAEEVFRTRAMQFMAEDIQAYLAQGQIEEAQHTLAKFRLPERMKVCGKEFRDMEAMQRGFESREEPLFRLPGALGDLLNPHFVRGGFMALLGREKIGKTWILMEMKFAALKAKCNVAMFQLGDLTEDDYRVRQGVRVAGKSNDPRYCKEIRIPQLDCYYNQRADCQVPGRKNLNTLAIINEDGSRIPELFEEAIHEQSHIPCCRCSKKSHEQFIGVPWYTIRPPVEPLTWREADKALQRYEKRHKLGKFKLSVHSNTTLSASGIHRQLEIWRDQDGFVPDVIIADYADIMAPEDSRQDIRAQENEKWKVMRRLSQDWHGLFITVTQGTRMGYDEDTLQGKHVSEDKRKLSHVTAFFSLNQTPAEKRAGMLRVAPIMEGVREGYYDIDKQVCVLQCLQIGQPVVTSFYRNKFNKCKE